MQCTINVLSLSLSIYMAIMHKGWKCSRWIKKGWFQCHMESKSKATVWRQKFYFDFWPSTCFRPLNRMLMGAFSLLVEEATYCSHHDQTLVTVFGYYYLSLSCVQISHSRTLQSQLFFHFCFAVKNIELYYSLIVSCTKLQLSFCFRFSFVLFKEFLELIKSIMSVNININGICVLSVISILKMIN